MRFSRILKKMYKKLSQKKKNLKSIICFILLLMLFYFTAREDRLYKGWRTDNEELFTSFLYIEGYTKRHIPINARVLMDISDLKNWDSLFKNKIYGKARRLLYCSKFPEIRKCVSRAKIEGFPLQVKRRAYTRKLKPFKHIHHSSLEKINETNLKGRIKFMLENNIEYYFCSFKDWRHKNRILSYKKFHLIRSSKRFVLCSVKDEDAEE